jgi:hypothetical protein
MEADANFKALTHLNEMLSKLTGAPEDRLLAVAAQAEDQHADTGKVLEMVHSLQLVLDGQPDEAIADAVLGGNRGQLSAINCLLDECCHSYSDGKHEDGVMFDDLREEVSADGGYCFNPATVTELVAHGQLNPFTRRELVLRPVTASVIGRYTVYTKPNDRVRRVQDEIDEDRLEQIRPALEPFEAGIGSEHMRGTDDGGRLERDRETLEHRRIDHASLAAPDGARLNYVPNQLSQIEVIADLCAASADGDTDMVQAILADTRLRNVDILKALRQAHHHRHEVTVDALLADRRGRGLISFT